MKAPKKVWDVWFRVGLDGKSQLSPKAGDGKVLAASDDTFLAELEIHRFHKDHNNKVVIRWINTDDGTVYPMFFDDFRAILFSGLSLKNMTKITGEWGYTKCGSYQGIQLRKVF